MDDNITSTVRFMILVIQTDLPGCSGERGLPGKSGCPVYRGLILLISYFGGKIILPVNRSSGKSGPGKSGSDCNRPSAPIFQIPKRLIVLIWKQSGQKEAI